MRRFALICCAVLLAHGLITADRTASAAPLTSITYDITGGDFGSIWPLLLTGPVTGVSVTYIPPGTLMGGSVSTPFTCNAKYGCGRLNFVVSGPGVAGAGTWYWFLDQVTITPNHFMGSARYQSSLVYTYISNPIWLRISANDGLGSAHSGYYTYATASAAIYTIGNEVRVPAPLDFDGDGIVDAFDNCLNTPNPAQDDTDCDTFGNLCDTDYDNSGIASFSDFFEFSAAFGTTDEEKVHRDPVSGKTVGHLDYGIFVKLFGNPPGPSGALVVCP